MSGGLVNGGGLPPPPPIPIEGATIIGTQFYLESTTGNVKYDCGPKTSLIGQIVINGLGQRHFS